MTRCYRSADACLEPVENLDDVTKQNVSKPLLSRLHTTLTFNWSTLPETKLRYSPIYLIRYAPGEA
jgi:hypothetical protein